jgi:hypothetical protein
VLANHDHGGAQPHQHGAAAQALPPQVQAWSQSSPTVVSVNVLDVLLTLAANAGDVLLVTHWPLPVPPLAIWFSLGSAFLLLYVCPSSPPEHPPRRLV